MFRKLNLLGGALVAAVLMAASTQAATLFDGSITTAGLNLNGPRSVIADIRNTAIPEPATMMLLGTGLLAAFRPVAARRKRH